ncbi:MAG TPA: hypothetical protein ENH82_11430 [bacterium]|nr:hypothetical protein [bacterium]
MTREEAIQEIESLYPTDSEFPKTNKIGLELLEQAKRNCKTGVICQMKSFSNTVVCVGRR